MAQLLTLEQELAPLRQRWLGDTILSDGPAPHPQRIIKIAYDGRLRKFYALAEDIKGPAEGRKQRCVHAAASSAVLEHILRQLIL
jgi:hypothetical protein